MPRSSDPRASEALKRFGNPYAFAEPDEVEADSRDAIAVSRRRLQNQWAHLNSSGGFDAASDAPGGARPNRRGMQDIEDAVSKLHRRLWEKRYELLPERLDDIDPVDLLDPSLAFGLIGYDFSRVAALGNMRVGAVTVEVAGRIDTTARSVEVGMHLPMSSVRFTAAHELGHAVLHPELGVMHRDIAQDGIALGSDLVEKEANRFATLFLMPERLVRAKFRALFLADRFEVSEESAFALAGCTVDALTRRHGTRRALSTLLAGTPRYNGRQVTPLHEQFRVSSKTMAIRLEELDLI
jgi:hypothetical protein